MICGSIGGGSTTGVGGAFNKGIRRGFVEGIDVIELDLAYSNSDGLLKRSSTFAKYAMKSSQLALTESYDLLVATSTPLTAAIPGIFAKWFRRKPFVFEVRDLWPELPRAMGVVTNPIILSLMAATEWIGYKSANRLIGLSPGIVEGIASKGVPSSNIVMIPNGCDLDIFSDVSEPWRPEGVADEDLMAVYAGTHGVANGLSILIEVADILRKKNRDDIKIVLVGSGKTKSQLIQQATSRGLTNIVFHEPVTKRKLAGLMASTNVGLQVLANVPAFYYGTSPNKFFDYLAAGVPVLNNYPGWVASLIQEERCGFVVPPENAEEFASALILASEDRQSLKKFGVNAKNLAVKSFDRNVLSKNWVREIEGVFLSR